MTKPQRVEMTFWPMLNLMVGIFIAVVAGNLATFYLLARFAGQVFGGGD